MEDEKIMKNMKEALKRTKKRGRKHKNHASNGSSSIDDELGDKLMKNWVFSSPPMGERSDSKKDVKTDDTNNTKINAFDRLMSKRAEPLSPISPEVNGVKSKKPKKLKRHNSMKSNQDDEENNSMDNNSKSIKKFFNGITTNASPVDESEVTRKRNRITEIETPIDTETEQNRRKKTRREKVELDSNENVDEIPTSIDVLPTSTRPRRSCAGRINYGILLSPEKADVVNKSSPSLNVAVVEIDDNSNSPKKSKKKLAPLFVKKVPKPVIDPAVKEARR